MADPEIKEALKRDRSPKFPYIGLGKALDRIEVLYGKVKRYEARVADIAKDWELSPKSSSTDRTIAAIQSFGLIEDTGSGDSRKIKLSELGARIISDKREGVRESLLAEAALKPPIMTEYARRWDGGRPDDAHALSQLQFEGGFTEEGARIFLRVFDETIRFAKSAIAGSSQPIENEPNEGKSNPKIGDFVQWTSGGVDQLRNPTQIVKISEDNQWVWVSGSNTGIPIGEVKIVSRPSSIDENPLQQFHQIGIREEKFALKEGDVILRYPSDMSLDSVDDLEAYLQIFLKKSKREATKDR